MDPSERHKKTMCKNVGDVNDLNPRRKTYIHTLSWEILWVIFLEVEFILRIGQERKRNTSGD